MQSPYRDRREAGRILAQQVLPFVPDAEPLILALPRGGVPVGFEVASALRAPLDVIVVRKLGVPWQPELGLGAITLPELARREGLSVRLCTHVWSVLGRKESPFPLSAIVSRWGDDAQQKDRRVLQLR